MYDDIQAVTRLLQEKEKVKVLSVESNEQELQPLSSF